MLPSQAELWIYRVDLDDEWPSADALPAEERERAAKMRAGEVRERWLAARWALRGVLGHCLEQEPARIELIVGERGKPMLADDRGSLRFNLSHSGDLALVAVTREREVGVDVERIRPRGDLLALARRALAPEDAARIEAAPPRSRLTAFHSAWARREAVAKCFGVGLGAPLPEEPVTVLDLDTGPGFAAAVAVAGNDALAVRRFAIGPDLAPVEGPTASPGVP